MTRSEPPIVSLLDELCVEFGFCLPPSERAHLESEYPRDVDSLTEAVFAGEGFDPKRADQTLWRQIRARVAKKFHTLLHPAITQDIGPLLASLAGQGFNVASARYDEQAFGNYYVDFNGHGQTFGVTRERGQYLIDAPVKLLESLGICHALDSHDELGAAVSKYIAATRV